MNIIIDLETSSTGVASLQSYLRNNFAKLYDFFIYEKHSNLVLEKNRINKYIQSNRNLILQLDVQDKLNISFISLLLDACEKLRLRSCFSFLYNHLIANRFNVGKRLEAASFYMMNVKSDYDYLSRFDAIYDRLCDALLDEDGNPDKVLYSMINYYAIVVFDFAQFNSSLVLELKRKFIHTRENSDFAKSRIQILLDSFVPAIDITSTSSDNFIIESNTNYCKLLAVAPSNFRALRQISVDEYQKIRADSIFKSLQRGVAVLSDESQLYAYMISYADMHYNKLVGAFNVIPASLFCANFDIIDWGCGQALASVAFIDIFNDRFAVNQLIDKIFLIEPSELALRRASLHLKKFHPTVEIQTVNKYFDDLTNKDFEQKPGRSHVHLFSNILDVDLFSLDLLLQNIDSSFPGNNLFICVSPYINDIRTSRLDSFVNYFSDRESFQKILEINNKQGQWQGNWSRVLRVFSVSL